MIFPTGRENFWEATVGEQAEAGERDWYEPENKYEDDYENESPLAGRNLSKIQLGIGGRKYEDRYEDGMTGQKRNGTEWKTRMRRNTKA